MMVSLFDKITFGNINSKKDAEGYCSFLRFTDRQLEFYKNSSEWHEKMSLCSAGIYFSFETDANEICFDYKIMFSARAWCTFDLYIDGNYIYTKDVGEQTEGNIKFSLDNTSNKVQTIKIYIPSLAILYVKNLDIKGSLHYVNRPHKTIFSFGDSITQGFDAQKASFTYPTLLSNFYDASILNQGIGGIGFSKGILCDFETLPMPDLITVAYGSNDWFFGENIHTVKENIEQFFERLNELYAKIPVLVITPLWRADIGDISKVGSLDSVIKVIAEKASKFKNISMIDGMKCIPHNHQFFGDGKIHPSDEGNLYYLQQIVKYTSKLGCIPEIT